MHTVCLLSRLAVQNMSYFQDLFQRMQGWANGDDIFGGLLECMVSQVQINPLSVS